MCRKADGGLHQHESCPPHHEASSCHPLIATPQGRGAAEVSGVFKAGQRGAVGHMDAVLSSCRRMQNCNTANPIPSVPVCVRTFLEASTHVRDPVRCAVSLEFMEAVDASGCCSAILCKCLQTASQLHQNWACQAACRSEAKQEVSLCAVGS